MNDSRKTSTFLIIWFGQMISMMGTGMTRFALLIWIYQQTGQATAMALLGFFSFGTSALFGPIAGYWVDQWDRRRVILYADLGAGLMTVGTIVLMTLGQLELWHLYLMMSLAGIFSAFQNPAEAAVTSVLLPKRHYARANGLRSLAMALRDVAAPLFAGSLLALVGIEGVMLVDIATFLFATVTLLFVHVSNPTKASIEEDEGDSMWQRLTFGARFIFRRKGLVYLLGIMTLINFLAALTYYGTMPAMLLARTGGDETALSAVQASLGLGGIIGSIIISIWGGPRRRIHGVLLGTGFSFLTGDFVFSMGQSVGLWVAAGVVTAAFIPMISSGNLAIWQSKVPPAYQGRVFSVQSALQTAMHPLGYLMGGLLADYLFEPAMMPGGGLVGIFGGLVGTGPGTGIGVMFFFTAVIGTAVGFGGYIFPALRNVESDLPDYDASPEPIMNREPVPVAASD